MKLITMNQIMPLFCCAGVKKRTVKAYAMRYQSFTAADE